MGLYGIQLKRGAVERIPATMTSLGFPLKRVEQRENGTCYFYEGPKSKLELAFWTHENGTGVFWFSGLSPSAKKIAEGFSAAGLFENDHSAS